MTNPNFKDKVIQIVQKIPYGRVTTYGTVATLVGFSRGARIVGGIMCSDGEKLNLPWHRVINREGYLSIKCGEHSKALQKALLEEEGVEVSADFIVNLDKYGWWGEGDLKS